MFYEATADLEIESEVGPIRLVRPHLILGLQVVLLGRRDFFSHYQVTFGKTEMTIGPNP